MPCRRDRHTPRADAAAVGRLDAKNRGTASWHPTRSVSRGTGMGVLRVAGVEPDLNDCALSLGETVVSVEHGAGGAVACLGRLLDSRIAVRRCCSCGGEKPPPLGCRSGRAGAEGSLVPGSAGVGWERP